MTTSTQHLSDPNQGDFIDIDVVAHSEDDARPAQAVAAEVVTAEVVTAEVVTAEVVTNTTWKDTPETHSIAPEVIPAQSVPSEGSSALVTTTTRGSFSSFLAPLKQETFKEVVFDVEQKLKVVNQTLSMLDMQGFDSILEEMLSSITFKTGELLNVDRTTIWLLDPERQELYTTIAQGAGGRSVELRIPADKGIVGEVATLKKVVNIPYDFYDDPRSQPAQEFDRKNNYRTYTMLTMPLENEETGELVAVVQLVNKLKPNPDFQAPLDQKIDQKGFTKEDERVFKDFAPSIRLILESSRSFYVATQKQRAANALIQATQSLSKSSLDLESTLGHVMDEAKKLMNADRSTLWLIDEERDQLWTKIPIGGSLQELRIPRAAGFAGQVATSGEPLLIPFDLYNNPNAETAKATDQKTGYRTCSMLCMPVFNADGKLIGVTQLVNKVKQGDYPAYDPADYPAAPECWKASFNRTDMDFMETFNIQAGVALQNAKLFETVKQQEQMQRDILRSLTNGVISTNKEGKIIAANESAKELLGMAEDEVIEGKSVQELVNMKKGDFSKWFENALLAKDEKSREQYYPDQTLESSGISEDEHSINLSINTIADASDRSKVSGVLVVMEDISDEKRLKSTMYRYMTQELAEQLLENPDAAKMGGDRKEVSVLFSDIRSYTTITESLTAEEVVEMLNKYFESMVDAVFQHKGTLDKYIGDAIMAVFGSPLPLEDHAWQAAQTAVEMRQRLEAFNQERIETKQQLIRIGIGINSDTVISGNIGSSKRMEFTAIGDGVNLGSRLESASKQYGTDIVISESTYRLCQAKGDLLRVRELDYIKVKGKTQPVAVYELVGLAEEPISDAWKRTIDLYHQGLAYYRDRKFVKAMNEFGTILEEINSQDKASTLHLDRCQYWLQNPPPDDWDGSWEMKEK